MSLYRNRSALTNSNDSVDVSDIQGQCLRSRIIPHGVFYWYCGLMLEYQFRDKYETDAEYNIAETCAASISLEDLQGFSDRKDSPLPISRNKLTYGSIRGSKELRTNLANLYSAKATTNFNADNILITPGAIAANLTAFYALIKKGDHVITHYPTYQQLYEVPASLGAEISLWRADENKQWSLNVKDLEGMLKPNTKMIVIKFVSFNYSEDDCLREQQPP